jgi:hypothetical protein
LKKIQEYRRNWLQHAQTDRQTECCVTQHWTYCTVTDQQAEETRETIKETSRYRRPNRCQVAQLHAGQMMIMMMMAAATTTTHMLDQAVRSTTGWQRLPNIHTSWMYMKCFGSPDSCELPDNEMLHTHQAGNTRCQWDWYTAITCSGVETTAVSAVGTQQ